MRPQSFLQLPHPWGRRGRGTPTFCIRGAHQEVAVLARIRLGGRDLGSRRLSPPKHKTHRVGEAPRSTGRRTPCARAAHLKGGRPAMCWEALLLVQSAESRAPRPTKPRRCFRRSSPTTSRRSSTAAQTQGPPAKERKRGGRAVVVSRVEMLPPHTMVRGCAGG